MLVALDANVWVKERLLRSAMGAALLYAVRHTGGRIVLPTVTRKEVLFQIVETGLKAVGQIKSGFATVHVIAGKRPDYRLPDGEELRRAAEARLEEIGDWLVPLEAELADYESAIDRVVEGRPPNAGRKEQFRDSLFLELLIPLARGETVHVVTGDGDFYDGGSGSGRVAKKLQEELVELGADIRFHASVEAFLDKLGPEAKKVDQEPLHNALHLAVFSRVEGMAGAKGYRLGEPLAAKTELYLTERHNVLAVSFELAYEAFDIPRRDGSVELAGKVVAEGSARYDLDGADAADVQLGKVTVYDGRGDVLSGYVSVFISGSGSITVGTVSIPYSLRERLLDTESQGGDERD